MMQDRICKNKKEIFNFKIVPLSWDNLILITSAKLITTVISCFALVEIVTIPTITQITVVAVAVMIWVIQIK